MPTSMLSPKLTYERHQTEYPAVREKIRKNYGINKSEIISTIAKNVLKAYPPTSEKLSDINSLQAQEFIIKAAAEFMVELDYFVDYATSDLLKQFLTNYNIHNSNETIEKMWKTFRTIEESGDPEILYYYTTIRDPAYSPEPYKVLECVLGLRPLNEVPLEDIAAAPPLALTYQGESKEISTEEPPKIAEVSTLKDKSHAIPLNEVLKEVPETSSTSVFRESSRLIPPSNNAPEQTSSTVNWKLGTGIAGIAVSSYFYVRNRSISIVTALTGAWLVVEGGVEAFQNATSSANTSVNTPDKVKQPKADVSVKKVEPTPGPVTKAIKLDEYYLEIPPILEIVKKHPGVFLPTDVTNYYFTRKAFEDLKSFLDMQHPRLDAVLPDPHTRKLFYLFTNTFLQRGYELTKEFPGVLAEQRAISWERRRKIFPFAPPAPYIRSIEAQVIAAESTNPKEARFQ